MDCLIEIHLWIDQRHLMKSTWCVKIQDALVIIIIRYWMDTRFGFLSVN